MPRKPCARFALDGVFIGAVHFARLFLPAALAAAWMCQISSGASAAALPPERLSSAAQRRALSLTVYADFAVVRDVRTVTVGAGTSRVLFAGVSAQLIPETAFFSDVASEHPLWVLEQNFDANLLTASSLFAAAVGGPVWLINTDPKSGRETLREAQLLSADGPILKVDNRIESGLPPNSRIAYYSIPAKLRTSPSFAATFGSTAADRPMVALNYITGGLGWSADYVAQLNAAGDQMSVDALATVINTSGTGFDNAQLQLVAGSVQRLNVAQAPAAVGEMTPRTASDMYSMSFNASTARHAVFEYYTYTIAHATTLLDKQAKQVALFSAKSVPVQTSYELDDSGPSVTERNGAEAALGVAAYLQFANRGLGLGIPLPAGTFHVYKRDAAGAAQFVGEDSIDHTAKNATVRLRVGASFDLTARRVQTGYREVVQPNRRVWYYSDYRITIASAKQKPVSVRVLEPMSGDWTITRENLRHLHLSSDRAQWNVVVPAGGSATLEYSVLVR